MAKAPTVKVGVEIESNEMRLLDKRLRESKTAIVGLIIIALLYGQAYYFAWLKLEWATIACVVSVAFVGVSYVLGTKAAETMVRSSFFGNGRSPTRRLLSQSPVEPLPMPTVTYSGPPVDTSEIDKRPPLEAPEVPTSDDEDTEKKADEEPPV